MLNLSEEGFGARNLLQAQIFGFGTPFKVFELRLVQLGVALQSPELALYFSLSSWVIFLGETYADVDWRVEIFNDLHGEESLCLICRCHVNVFH